MGLHGVIIFSLIFKHVIIAVLKTRCLNISSTCHFTVAGFMVVGRQGATILNMSLHCCRLQRWKRLLRSKHMCWKGSHDQCFIQRSSQVQSSGSFLVTTLCFLPTIGEAMQGYRLPATIYSIIYNGPRLRVWNISYVPRLDCGTVGIIFSTYQPQFVSLIIDVKRHSPVINDIFRMN